MAFDLQGYAKTEEVTIRINGMHEPFAVLVFGESVRVILAGEAAGCLSLARKLVEAAVAMSPSPPPEATELLATIKLLEAR